MWKPLFETLRTLRTSLYSSLSRTVPSHIEESQEMLLHKYFFLSKKNTLLDSTTQKPSFDFSPCVLCGAENTVGAGQLLAEWPQKCRKDSRFNVFIEGRNRKKRREERQSYLCSFSNKRHRNELAWRIQEDWRSAEFHVGPWELHVIYILSLLDKTLLAGKHVKSKWQFKVKG